MLIATDKQLETLRTASKYKYQEIIVQNDFGIWEEIYSKTDLNKEQRIFIKEYCK